MCRDARRRGLAAALAAALCPAPLPAQEPPAPVEVRVQGGPRPRDPGRVAVSSEEGRRVPGTGGDAIKAVESLPGVGRAAFDGGKLVLWGAAPSETRVLVDGVEIPALFHGGGLRSVVNASLVQGLELVPGAYGPEHGRGLGGLVKLRTRELPADGWHGQASVDVLDSSATVSAALGGRLRVAIGGRVSHLDRVLSGVAPPDLGDLVPVPRYRDYLAKATLDLREDERLDLLLLGFGDELTRSVGSSSVLRLRSEASSSSSHRALLRYARSLPDGSSVEVTPFVGRDLRSLRLSSGPVLAADDEAAWKYGVRASYRAPLSPALSASVGVDAQGSTSALSRLGSLSIPHREGDLYVFGQPPGPDVNADRWTATILDVAPFVQLDLRLGPVSLSPGLRLDAYLIEGSRLTPRAGDTTAIGFSRLEPALAPRVALGWAATDRLSLSAAAGLFHQAPDASDLSAVFGTPSLSLQRATHLSAGQSLRISGDFTLETTAFYRNLEHLVARSRLATPRLAQALTQDGQGRSFGVQWLARLRSRGGLFGWLAHTASRSERRSLGDPTFRLLDDDQSHVLALVAGFERGGWGAGGRLRYTSGAPRTPVIGSFYETTSGQFEPVFGPQNSTRLPPFFQLDLRLERKLSRGAASLTLYLDLLNVTFHKNAEELAYSADYRRRGAISGLPTLAVLGARAER